MGRKAIGRDRVLEALVALSENERIVVAFSQHAKRPRVEQVFYALHAVAQRDAKGRLVVKDPFGALAAHLSKASVSRYVGMLESAKSVEVVRDGTGRGRLGISKVILLKTNAAMCPASRTKPKQVSVPVAQKVHTARRRTIFDRAPSPHAVISCAQIVAHRTAQAASLAKPAEPRIAVFLDLDNLIIGGKEYGAVFNPQYMIDDLRRRVQGNIISVFACISALTERSNPAVAQQVRNLKVLGLQYVVTGNTPDEADFRVCTKILECLLHNGADTYVIGTSDGGEHFVETVRCIRNARRRIVLMKYGRSYVKSLRTLADVCIDVSPGSALLSILARIVRDISLGRLIVPSPEATFFRDVAVAVMRACASLGGATFPKIAERTWQILYSRWHKTRCLADVKAALTALNGPTKDAIFREVRGDNGQKFLMLKRDEPVLNILAV